MSQSQPAPERQDSNRIYHVLSNKHAREILRQIATDSKTIQDLTAVCSASRVTIYRQLDRLQEAGLVSTQMSYDPDGHHRRTYRARHAEITIAVGHEGLTVDIDHRCQ
ncbi:MULTISPECIES: ArsR/SmtB family transcription factor [Halomicrobium]|uniref:Transcriptional regulator, ArsR family n=2 Tax=Halomicrobium mukohataei TaxID=57705 RepID=C7P009_HALMD|nr:MULTISPECIES: winged helix-turn-helix domain-containing protein [Halomicrobium]ACV46917.1 transcriptional regulator, ArsR family [Halomicrobium mukohataei DSM 12286]QCD65416.1 ArsR family transcriptional regulator [Halomicrobium mukohataei]QFR20222.1 ArsR family transcriptional regulator [Halomicrobium sp. ZPS1]